MTALALRTYGSPMKPTASTSPATASESSSLDS
jgi:hypothetical protein